MAVALAPVIGPRVDKVDWQKATIASRTNSSTGITSGASAPEELVEDLVSLFKQRGAESISELKTVDEDVRFMLPGKIRRDLVARGESSTGTELPVVG